MQFHLTCTTNLAVQRNDCRSCSTTVHAVATVASAKIQKVFFLPLPQAKLASVSATLSQSNKASAKIFTIKPEQGSAEKNKRPSGVGM